MYQVTQRSMDSNYISGEGKRGDAEILNRGNDHTRLYAALVEADARNVAQGAGKPRWTVEQDGVDVSHDDIMTEDVQVSDVCEYLVEQMGYTADDADKLVTQ